MVAEAFLALEAVEEVLLVVSLVAFLRKVGDAIGYHQSLVVGAKAHLLGVESEVFGYLDVEFWLVLELNANLL